MSCIGIAFLKLCQYVQIYTIYTFGPKDTKTLLHSLQFSFHWSNLEKP